MYEISGKQMQTVEQQHSTICKQRAALKKLAARYRERGKALVEERADVKISHICNCETCMEKPGFWDGIEKYKAKCRAEAREQLRREGKI